MSKEQRQPERGTTFHQFTLPEETPGGRYRKLEPQTIVGRDNPIPEYTHAAAWSETQLPDEPPLGYAIDDQEPVGTIQEIEQSLGDGSTVPTSVVEGRSSSSSAASTKGGASSDRLSSLKGAAHQFKRRV